MSQRLLAGACAGMSATLVTHPLDVVRLRLSLPHAGYTGKLSCTATCQCWLTDNSCVLDSQGFIQIQPSSDVCMSCYEHVSGAEHLHHESDLGVQSINEGKG